MRIAVISYKLPVIGEKYGGIECVAHELADGLARRGHLVTVWTYDEKPVNAAYQVRPLRGKRFFDSRLGTRLTMGYLGNFLALVPDYKECDAIIAHGDSLLLPLKGIPVIRVMHGSALGEMLSAKTAWRFLMQLGVYPQELLTSLIWSGCIANSNSTTRYNPFIRRVIPLGTDLNEFFPDPLSKTQFPSILFVGTLDGRKRGRRLIEWFKELIRPTLPTARLRMVSPAGPPEEGVSYHTGVSKKELAALYRSSWVYATPSTYEGFGLPYVEAMASGTPVVATCNPGSKEILGNGCYGRLPPDSEFAQTIRDLLQDAKARDLLAATGVERAQEYALTRMVEDYERLLSESCERKTAESHD